MTTLNIKYTYQIKTVPVNFNQFDSLIMQAINWHMKKNNKAMRFMWTLFFFNAFKVSTEFNVVVMFCVEIHLQSPSYLSQTIFAS